MMKQYMIRNRKEKNMEQRCRHFIAVLGTNFYTDCVYQVKEEGFSYKTPYAQLAVLKHVMPDAAEGDRITILLTERAEQENWLDRDYRERELQILGDRGVLVRPGEKKTGFRKILQEEYPQIPAETVRIREGRNREELDEIFEKMYASVQGILAEKLSPFSFSGVLAMMNHPQKISLSRIGERKTAVFLHISDTDRSMDRLATLFYTQALHVLCRSADKRKNNRLKVPVRLILDDFAAGADSCIPDFDKIISVIRSREISVSVILQSLSQLEASYGHNKAMTIVNNCDHLLYLGGQDVETARYIATKANKSVNTVLNMPLDDAWLFTRGEAPRQVQKYNLKEHPLYHQMQKHASKRNRELIEDKAAFCELPF